MPPKAAAAPKATIGKGKAVSPKKLIVVLKVDKTKLATFRTAKETTTSIKSPLSSAGSHTPRKSSPLAVGGLSANDVAASPNPEQQEGTPAPSVATSTAGTDLPVGAASAKPAPKRRAPGGGGAKAGRKKQRVDGAGMNGGGSSTSHPKLGPKSNLGAINAHLRALDRSGAPCKRWSKKGFQLKSFTGVQWELPKWATPTVEKSLNLMELSQPTKDAKTEKEEKKDGIVGKEEVAKPVSHTEGEPLLKSEAAVPIVVTPPKEDTDVPMADVEPVAAVL